MVLQWLPGVTSALPVECFAGCFAGCFAETFVVAFAGVVTGGLIVVMAQMTAWGAGAVAAVAAAAVVVAQLGYDSDHFVDLKDLQISHSEPRDLLREVERQVNSAEKILQLSLEWYLVPSEESHY